MDVVKTVQTEWEAPVVFESKKNGTLLSCVNCCRFKPLNIRDSYSMQRSDESTNFFGDATSFWTTEANIDYWQVEIADKDRNKTALLLFTVDSVLFRCHLS